MSDDRHVHPVSSSRVQIVVARNGTFSDAYQFDPPVAGVTGPAWSLAPNFRMDVKASYEDPTPLLSFSTATSQIIVDDAIQRVIHFNVPESVIQAVLVPGKYVYDLIMYDNGVPPLRVPLMHGEFVLTDGVTGG